MTIEPGPEPDPDAPAHGDFDPDDVVTEVEDPGDEDAEPVQLITAEDAKTFAVDYEGTS